MRRAHSNCIAIALAILLLAFCTAATAEEPNTNTENTGVFTLGDVIVEDETETPKGTVSRVDEETLRRFNRDDLAEALDLMPGVALSRTGARNERTIHVRGLDLKHVPLFLDGIPIYVMYDGYSDLGRFTTFDTSQIVLSKGAASVLYGFNTMGGAINVITKRPDKPFETNGGIGMAEGDTTTTYANFGSRQGDWYIQGGASYVNRDYYHLSDDFDKTAAEDGDKRENSYLTDQKINFRIGYQPTPDDEYAFSYIKQEAEKGTPPYAGDDPTQTIRYWQWPRWDKESFYFNSRTGLGADSYIKTRLYYDSYKNSLFSYDDATYTTQIRRSSFKSWYDDDTIGGSLEMGTKLLDRNDLKAAVHFKRDRHEELDEGEPELSFKDDYYSVALEDTITLTDRWHVVAGASYDWQIAQEAEDYDSNTGIISDFPTEDTSVFNPQIGFYHNFSDTDTAYVTIARKSRLASLKDRYSYRMGTALPNPGLDPEIAVNYDVGYKGTFDNITFQSAIFYSDVKDYIQSVVVPDPDDPASTLNQNQNVGEVQLYGAEVDLAARFTNSLDGGLGYTYTGWNNRSNAEKITNIPKHKIRAYAHYTLWEKLGLTVDADHYAGRYSSSDGNRKTRSFTIANVKADYALFNGFKLEAGINNIFDKNYEVEEGYPEEGASFFANVTFRY